MIFDKVEKMAKESYFKLELELNKNNLKKTWEILRQSIHKQNKRPTIPDTSIYIYIYNSVLTCRQNIINSSASAPLNATTIAVKKVSDVDVCMFGPEL